MGASLAGGGVGAKGYPDRMPQPHPRMIEPDDPFVVRVREAALGYPGAIEVEAWGRPSFRVGGASPKIFLLVSNHQQPHSITFKPDPGDEAALRQDPRFWLPPYWGAGGWLCVDTDRDDVEWDEVRELIDASYRQIALRRQIAELDARGPMR